MGNTTGGMLMANQIPGDTNVSLNNRTALLNKQVDELQTSIGNITRDRALQINATINVTAPPGADGNVIGKIIREHIADEARKIQRGGN